MTPALRFKLRAVTGIWTGNAGGHNTFLQLTSFIGSIRWWAEAIVRAHGIHACDPATPAGWCMTRLCPICELFGNPGCDGRPPQAAKFMLRAWEDGPPPLRARTQPLAAGDTFRLEFHFPSSRNPGVSICDIALLAKTVSLIANYGSLGGRTIRKPNQNAPGTQRHEDYGLISIQSLSGVTTTQIADCWTPAAPVPASVTAFPNLDRFWFLPEQAAYHDAAPYFNDLLGLTQANPPAKTLFRDNLNNVRQHVRGVVGMSKKVFAFGAPARMWGYILEPALWDRSQITAWLTAAGVNAAGLVWGEDIK